MYHPMSTPNPRKRPAPGASPAVALTQMQNPYSNTSGGNMARWNGAADGSGLVDSTSQTVNPFGLVPAQGQYVQGASVPSGALARRQNNHALVPTGPHAGFDTAVGTWEPFIGDETALMPQSANGNMAEHDSIETLEEAAQKAKREAQSKRKQIPPFVQKLSSFLDEKKNEDLIRWSDNGDSFIVLDEDEFAKTLIPELFKHNNYASFVRQLNMYGFHKRVGLSDNSMRASERKNKSPSEYSNPYFRRGHPNLLWLINKAKSGSKGKKSGKAAEGDVDSEEDVGAEEVPGGQVTGSAAPVAGDHSPLQKKELTMLKEELSKVREQQKMILTAINRIQANNSQLYNQAMVFQSQHERHQNSINAILNFLANVFRKTLEDQGGAQNVNELLAGIIPNAQAPPPGSVVDLGDYLQPGSSVLNPLNAPKRARGLLPPIPNQGRANTVASTPASTPGAALFSAAGNHNPEMGTVTELFDTPTDTTSPNYLQELESNPHEGMMKIINNTNAYNNSGIDLPEVVNNTTASLSDDQRNHMMNIMAQTSAPAQPSVPATSGSGTSVRTPQRPAPVNPMAMPSSSAGQISPIMASVPPPPSLQQISSHRDELEALQRMQQEQAAKIEELSHLLGPLSPSGRIPGIDEADEVPGYFSDHNLDIDQFLDSNAFLDPNDYSGHPISGEGSNFNFSLDGPADQGNGGGGLETGRVIGSGSTAPNTPSPSGTEEILHNEVDTPSHSTKRRRVG